jgi:hypothetical protein
MKGRSFEWGRVRHSVDWRHTAPRRDCYVNCPIGRVSVEGVVPGTGSSVPLRHIQAAVVESGEREYRAHAHRRVTI